MCEWEVSQAEVTVLNMVLFAGIFVGSPVIGYIADLHGRKTSLIFASCWVAFYGLLRQASLMTI